MDVGQLVQQAMQAEQQGIPVNWKELCITVLNAAVGSIRVLEEKAAEQAVPPAP